MLRKLVARIVKGQRGASTIMLGLSMAFIAIGVIIFPITLEATDATIDHKGAYSETDNVTTITGVTSANMTLDNTLYHESVGEVITISSASGNATTDSPVVASWTSANKLNVTGLQANRNRNITVNYNYANVDTYTGVEPVAKVVPLLILISFISAGIIAGYFGFKA